MDLISQNILAKYRNGNSIVTIYEDGTREIETEDNEFIFDFPMNADIKITNQCFMGCDMCHENSVPNGKHAPLENFEFLKSWNRGCECAFGGGMVTLYPHLDALLEMTKECGLIANATFHQDELIKNFDRIKSYQDQGLLYGIGVSYSHPDEKLIKCVNQLNNVVFHVIAGLARYEDLRYLSENFNKPKILVLGYKTFRRGNQLYDKIGNVIDKEIEILSRNIDWLFLHFNVVSFDNLALNQLDVKSWLTEDQWDEFYQGEEGSSNMYVDAVEGKFAQNSTSDIRYDLKNDIKEMFDVIKNNN